MKVTKLFKKLGKADRKEKKGKERASERTPVHEVSTSRRPPTTEERQQIKCVVVGDGGVGKTCMLFSYVYNRFPEEYVPTIFDNFTVNVDIADQVYALSLYDTAGQEDFDRLRSLAYPNTDVFIIAYSVMNRASFDNVRSKWVPDIRANNPNTPIVLAATQVDIREDEPEPDLRDFISTMEGQRLSRDLRLNGFVECSALTQHNLRALFKEAIVMGVQGPMVAARGARDCIVM